MVKITGAKAHADRLRRLAETMGPELSKALFNAGQAVQAEAQILITNGSASGTKTKKHLHVPSAPGEPPHNFTGHLANNIEAVLVEPLKVEVTSKAEYAAHLEYGTSKMAARPYMAPALALAQKEFPEIFTAAVRRGIKAAK